MADIKSNYGSPLGIPGGPTIAPGATAKVERWKFVKDSYIVKTWLDAGVIEVVADDEERDTAPEGGGGDQDEPKTAAEVLAMANTVHFQTFKAEAVKLLGDATPSRKEDIVAALEERATAPE